MSVDRTQARRGARLAIKRALLEGLEAELEAQSAANAGDREASPGMPSLAGLPALVMPTSIELAPQGALSYWTENLPGIRIVALSGSSVDMHAIDTAGLAAWQIGIYVQVDNRLDLPAYQLSVGEVTELLIESYMDAMRIALQALKTGAYDRYGVHAVTYVTDRVLVVQADHADQPTRLIGEQIWSVEQTVRSV